MCEFTNILSVGTGPIPIDTAPWDRFQTDPACPLGQVSDWSWISKALELVGRENVRAHADTLCPLVRSRLMPQLPGCRALFCPPKRHWHFRFQDCKRRAGGETCRWCDV